MGRWWDKYGFGTTLVVLALIVALVIKQTQASVLSEVHFLVTSPFQSKAQFSLEDRLTNARVLELEQKVAELEQQNKQLKELLDYSSTQIAKTITAPVVGRSRDRWWNRVTLGKGSKDNVKPGYVVLGIGGLIGRITHVTPHTSKVLLISDDTSRVGAIMSKNRQLGYVQGENSSSVAMYFFDQITDVKPGDLITTSFLSKLYPPGLAIGKVHSLAETKDAETKDKDTKSKTMIELAAPIEVLEWVSILPFEPKF